MNVILNGQSQEVPEGTSLAQLLERLKLPARGLAVELNLAVVPRARHAEHLLRDGDRLEVVTLVGGG